MADEHADNRETVEAVAREASIRKSDRARTLHRRLVQLLSTGGDNLRSALAQQRREEREDFAALSRADREWICFLLDMRSFPPKNPAEWGMVFPAHLVLAAADVVMRTTGEANAGNRRSVNDDDCRAFQPMLDMALFSLRHGRCTASASFAFLHVRLFGGRSRPFAASVFAAAALHPSLVTGTISFSADDLSRTDNRDEPVFWPERPDIVGV